jgi:hypothetical protein
VSGAGSTEVGTEVAYLKFGAATLGKKSIETTSYSLSTAAPQQDDRRNDERHLSLLRVGALLIDGRRELCLIRNISAGGMMIRPYSVIASQTPLSVELKQGNTVSGIAQWSDNGLIGITFDTPIDVVALLSGTGDGPQPRMPRIELSCTATLRHDGDVFRARVVNISQGGIRVNSDSELQLDADVVVSLAGLHAAAGVVKWKDGNDYGVGFNRVFPVHELMQFLQEQQLDERRAAC